MLPSDQLSAISYQLSAISYQLSAISYQLSAAGLNNGQTSHNISRMKTLATLLAGIVIGAVGMTALAAVPVGPADHATKAAVTEVKRGIVAGHKARDRASLDRLYADDYTAIDSKGAIRTKQDLLQALPTDAEIVEGQYDIIAVRRWGNMAVATGRGNLVYRNADGSTRVSNYYSFNVFEKRDGHWVYSAAFLP